MLKSLFWKVRAAFSLVRADDNGSPILTVEISSETLKTIKLQAEEAGISVEHQASLLLWLSASRLRWARAIRELEEVH